MVNSENILRKGLETIEKTKKTIGRTIDSGKRIVHISSLKNQIEETEKLLGAKCYQLIVNQNNINEDKDVLFYIEKITQIKKDIKKIESGGKMCSKCNRINDADATYCQFDRNKLL